MRHALLLAALATVVAACDGPSTAPVASPSLAAANGNGNVNGNKLQCFSGGGGSCTLTREGVATLDNPAGGFSGVYIANTNLDGKRLGDVNQLGFSYTGVPGAGAPRISLPIDMDGDGAWDAFAFIAAYYCNDGAGNVDVMADATCTIYVGSDPTPYENWAALVAAHPDWRIADDALAFVIADEPGTWTVRDVRLGRGPARAAH